MKKLFVLLMTVLLVITISTPAFAGGRNDRGYYNNRGRSYNYRPPVRIQRGYGNRGGGFDRSFERGFGTTLGVGAGILVFKTAGKIVDHIFDDDKEVIVIRQPALPSSGSTYSQAYEEEMLRLRQREFYRQQVLAAKKGIQDAQRDFYGK